MGFQLKLADFSNRKFLKALIYGDSGTGKTTLATTFPGPVLAIDVGEKGYIAFAEDIQKGKLDVTEIEDFQQLLDTMIYLRDMETKYKTIIIDSMTGLSNMAIASYLKSKGKKITVETALKWGGLAMSDYNEIATKVKPLVTMIKELEMNVVFTAHMKAADKIEFKSNDEDLEMEIEDETLDNIEEEKERRLKDKELNELRYKPLYVPSISKSLSLTLGAAVDYVFHTYIDATGRKPLYGIHVGPNKIYHTKARLAKGNEPPHHIESPTYQKIADMVWGKEEPASSKESAIKETKQETKKGK